MLILLGMLVLIMILYEVRSENQQPKIYLYTIYPKEIIKTTYYQITCPEIKEIEQKE
jgi:hypothetical protein